MKLYLHQTDGGAEYYTTEEHNIRTTVCRTDGDEFELMNPKQLKAAGFESIKLDIFDDWEKDLLNEAIICKIRANANAQMNISNSGAIDALNKENEFLVNIQKRINELFKEF